ncbi:MAG: hypothetical protein ACREPM_01750 [Gemmatimonadaceae bacterium]
MTLGLARLSVGERRRELHGAYMNVNGTVTLTSTAGNGVDVATIAGTKMTIIFQGHTLVYVRG